MNQHQPDPFDDRVVCTGCWFLVADRRCRNWQAARLCGPEVGAIKTLPQRCPGFAPLATEPKTESRPSPTETRPSPTENRPSPTNPSIEHEEPDMIVSENAGGSTFTPCPAGSYLARCVRLVDLGTQQTEYQGESKSAHKVLLAFEILDADTRRDDGEPFLLSKRYTLSLHEKAALRKELASWRGRDFTPEELKGFDLRNVLGKECFISVVESTKGDRTYSNIASIMKPPKGMQAPAGAEPLVYWDMSADAPDWAGLNMLHPKLIEQVEASPEFKRLKPPKRVQVPARAPAPAPEPDASGFDDLPDFEEPAF
ncbi:MAG TPA: hypothetical protein PKC60_00380 [Hydrogenophaga sp.]|uniref:phage replication initiation protein, NGO0469 family n=1 Tax=Hydrogenophaga sp. TaxID=1904254 RepID=UPI002CFACA56|nr:hypothetical protein [Hydrogenophaga sp.]HMN91661.1 hypothetical protein [Hydrogenophaga sp.]